MTRIGAIRFAIIQSYKAASDFPAPRRLGWKHTLTLALQVGIRLSKSAHRRPGRDSVDGHGGRLPTMRPEPVRISNTHIAHKHSAFATIQHLFLPQDESEQFRPALIESLSDHDGRDEHFSSLFQVL